MAPSLTSDAEMQVNIHTPDKTVPVYIRPSDTVRTLKSKIHDKEGIPSSLQVLLFAGVLLDDAKTLAYHGVQQHSTITLTGAMTASIGANGFPGWY
ncbi:ubiquitin-related domain-containing protein [Fomes fomentarius]|nr:ubiquitin-related domain-containing protein [Fomes fomentarius]